MKTTLKIIILMALATIGCSPTEKPLARSSQAKSDSKASLKKTPVSNGEGFSLQMDWNYASNVDLFYIHICHDKACLDCIINEEVKSTSIALTSASFAQNQDSDLYLCIDAKKGDQIYQDIVTQKFSISSVKTTTVVDQATMPELTHASTLSMDEDTSSQVKINANSLASGSECNSTLLASANTPGIFAKLDFSGKTPDCTLTLVPAANKNTSESIVTLSSRTTIQIKESQIKIAIAAIDDAPTISTIKDISVNEHAIIPSIPLAISDVDSTLACSNINIQFSDLSFIESSQITGTYPRCLLNLRAAGQQTGVVTVTVNVTSGSYTASTNFKLNIVPIDDAPAIAQLPELTIPEDQSSGNIEVTISDPDTVLTCNSLKAIFDNIAVVNKIVISGTIPKCFINITPVTNASGAALVTLSATDGKTPVSSQFRVVVTSDNDTPMISRVNDILVSKGSQTQDVLVPVFDVDSQLNCSMLTATAANQTLFSKIEVSGTAPNCHVRLTPAPTQTGSSNIALAISDGSLIGRQNFQFVVRGINEPPSFPSAIADVIVNEHSAATVIVPIADPDSMITCAQNFKAIPSQIDVLSNISISQGDGACLVTFQAVPNTSATNMPVTLQLNDEATTVTQIIALSIILENDTPTIAGLSDQTTLEDTTTSFSFQIDDADSQINCQQNVSATETSIHPILNSLVVTGSAKSCLLTINPSLYKSGQAQITVTVNDHNATSPGIAQKSFFLTITDVNHPPVISPISNVSSLENAVIGAILVSISDPDTNAVPCGSLIATSSNINRVSAAISGTNAPCTLTLTPGLNQYGTATISLQATDAAGAVGSTSFNISIAFVNQAPVLSVSSDTISVTQNSSAQNVAISITDVDSSNLNVNTQNLNPSLLSTNLTGSVQSGYNLAISFQPNTHGTGIVRLTASDGSLTVTRDINVTVTHVNQPPTLVLGEGSMPAISAINVSSAETRYIFSLSDIDSSLTCSNVAVTSSSPLITFISNASGSSINACSVSVSHHSSNTGTAYLTATVSDFDSQMPGTASLPLTLQVNPNTSQVDAFFVARYYSEDNFTGTQVLRRSILDQAIDLTSYPSVQSIWVPGGSILNACKLNGTQCHSVFGSQGASSVSYLRNNYPLVSLQAYNGDPFVVDMGDPYGNTKKFLNQTFACTNQSIRLLIPYGYQLEQGSSIFTPATGGSLTPGSSCKLSAPTATKFVTFYNAGGSQIVSIYPGGSYAFSSSNLPASAIVNGLIVRSCGNNGDTSIGGCRDTYGDLGSTQLDYLLSYNYTLTVDLNASGLPFTTIYRNDQPTLYKDDSQTTCSGQFLVPSGYYIKNCVGTSCDIIGSSTNSNEGSCTLQQFGVDTLNDGISIKAAFKIFIETERMTSKDYLLTPLEPATTYTSLSSTWPAAGSKRIGIYNEGVGNGMSASDTFVGFSNRDPSQYFMFVYQNGSSTLKKCNAYEFDVKMDRDEAASITRILIPSNKSLSINYGSGSSINLSTNYSNFSMGNLRDPLKNTYKDLRATNTLTCSSDVSPIASVYWVYYEDSQTLRINNINTGSASVSNYFSCSKLFIPDGYRLKVSTGHTISSNCTIRFPNGNLAGNAYTFSDITRYSGSTVTRCAVGVSGCP